MQAQTNTIFAEITEVKEVRVAECNQLLKEGWVLLGIYPITTVADMSQSQPQPEEGSKRGGDPFQYVRRRVVYVVGRRR